MTTFILLLKILRYVIFFISGVICAGLGACPLWADDKPTTYVFLSCFALSILTLPTIPYGDLMGGIRRFVATWEERP